jgi:predicted nucleic acid-binding protein
MRVVLDTDVVVAGLRSSRGASREWLRAVLRSEAEAVLSVPLVLQYEAVLLRPATLAAIGGSRRRVGRFLDVLCAVGLAVETPFLWRPMLRDPNDEMVLEAAVRGRVDLLLTFNLRDFAGSRRLGVEAARPGPAWRQWRGGS